MEGNVAEHTVGAIQERGKLIVATESQYAPFEFKDVEGNIIGLDPVSYTHLRPRLPRKKAAAREANRGW